MAMNPYDLDEPFAAVAAEVESPDHDGAESLEEVAAAAGLDLLGFDQRAENLIRWERNLAVEEEMLRAELKRLTAKRQAVENRRAGVREYLRACLTLAGRDKVWTPVGTASISPGRESVVVDIGRVYDWPSEVFARVCEEQPPKVRKDVLRGLPAGVLRELAGVSVEIGPDILTIR